MPAPVASLVTLLTPYCESVLAWLWRCSWQAAVVAGVVLVVRQVCGRWLTPGWRYALWSLVLVRLVMPTGPANPWSVFNIPSPFTHSQPWESLRPQIPLPPVEPVKSTETKPVIRFGSLPPEGLVVTPQAAPAPAKTSLPVWLFLGWLATTLLLLARLLMTNRAFWARVRRSTFSAPPHAVDLLGQCRLEMGLRRKPRLIVTDAVSSPALAGLRGTKILLPPALVNDLSSADLRMILLHELAHFRGCDVALDWLWTLLQLTHWFNPVLWFAGSRARADRELARDADVLRITGRAEADAYGSMLLRLVHGVRPTRLRAGLIGALQAKSRLRERVRWIARTPVGSKGLAGLGFSVLSLVGCATLSNPRQAAKPGDGNTPKLDRDARDRAMEHRVYDVRDLVLDVPNFDDPPDLSLVAPTTQVAVPVPTGKEVGRAARVDNLIQAIRDTVDPDSWTSPKQIRELQGQLIILQTPRNQQRITAMLEQLRETRGVQVMVEARFLTVDEKWFDADGPAQRTLKVVPATRPAAGQALDDTQLSQLLVTLQTDANSTLLTAPRITLFNGQRAYVMISTQRAYVADLKPIFGEGKNVAYEPTIGTVNSGIVLDVQATVSADRKSVALNLRPQISHLGRMENIPYDKEKNLVIQRPVVSVDSMRTTVSVPDQQTLVFTGFSPKTVIGAMPPGAGRAAGEPESFPILSSGPTTAPAGKELEGFGPGRRVFLFVKPTIILPQPVTTPQPPFPLLQPK